MKKLLLTPLCWLMLLPLAWAQNKMSCCTKPATEKFAAFASNQEFVSSHANPLPYKHVNATGENIQFPVKGGGDGKAYLVKAKTESDMYLFVFHEWWGLNDYIMKKTDELAKSLPGVNVMAIDLYDGNVATDKEQAEQYMKEVTTERAAGIINGAYTYVGKSSMVATIGWCFGGSWSLQAAIMGGKRSIGCVMYYGMPETDTKKLKSLKTDVFGIFAKKDNYITPEIVKEFQANMTKVGNVVTVKSYDADHAFANPSSPAYNNAFAIAADKAALGYLKKKIAANK